MSDMKTSKTFQVGKKKSEGQKLTPYIFLSPINNSFLEAALSRLPLFIILLEECHMLLAFMSGIWQILVFSEANGHPLESAQALLARRERGREND